MVVLLGLRPTGAEERFESDRRLVSGLERHFTSESCPSGDSMTNVSIPTAVLVAVCSHWCKTARPERGDEPRRRTAAHQRSDGGT